MKPNVPGYGYSVTGNGGYSYFWAAFNTRKSPQMSHRAAFDLESNDENTPHGNGTTFVSQEYEATTFIGYFFPLYEIKTRKFANGILSLLSNVFLELLE